MIRWKLSLAEAVEAQCDGQGCGREGPERLQLLFTVLSNVVELRSREMGTHGVWAPQPVVVRFGE